MNWELHRDAASFTDAGLDAVHQEDVNLVTRRDITAGLRDTDNGLLALQLFAGELLVLVALYIESGHAWVIWVVEPLLGTKTLVGLGIGHAMNSWLVFISVIFIGL